MLKNFFCLISTAFVTFLLNFRILEKSSFSLEITLEFLLDFFFLGLLPLGSLFKVPILDSATILTCKELFFFNYLVCFGF